MKIILLIVSLLISGCTSNHSLNINNVQIINYNNVILMDNDFNQVVNEINKLKFRTKKISGSYNKELTITTNEKIYNFKIYNNTIFYEEDDKTFVADNINTLNDNLQKLKDEYTDFSFFELSYHTCKINDNNFIVKLDNTNNCITLNTKKIIYNLKINSIQATEDYFIEDNLLYQNDEIKSNNIIIKTDILTVPKYKISFETEYKYIVSILPIYNQEENKIDYNISHEQKKQA